MTPDPAKNDLLNLIITSGHSHMNDAENRLSVLEDQFRQIRERLAVIETLLGKDGQ